MATKKPTKRATPKLNSKKSISPPTATNSKVVAAHNRGSVTANKRSLKAFWKTRYLWQKIVLLVSAMVVGFFVVIYISAIGYKLANNDEPLQYGVTFIPNYARQFGLDPEETLTALRDDLGFRRFRLVSYWSSIEKKPGEYDFSSLDWQFKKVAEVNGDITLAIGLRQPRWPECHIPDIYKDESIEQLYPKLEKFITAVVQRYKNHPSLESYQLENEFFLKAFGKCPDFSRERLNKEFNLVKKIDSNTPIIISLSNNYWGLPIGEPRPDIHGVSIYKRVYDYTVTKSYFEYPFPSWYYTGRAGLTQLFTGKKSMIHELQAEPWAPTSVDKASIEEQDKSMDAKRLKERLAYAKAIGFKKIDLWGGEWWYWRKVRFNDPSLWNTIKNEIPPQNR